jgi:hypothetical protein
MIRAAADAAAKGHVGASSNILGAFKQFVQAQAGKHISEVVAAILLQNAGSL